MLCYLSSGLGREWLPLPGTEDSGRDPLWTGGSTGRAASSVGPVWGSDGSEVLRALSGSRGHLEQSLKSDRECEEFGGFQVDSWKGHMGSLQAPSSLPRWAFQGPLLRKGMVLPQPLSLHLRKVCQVEILPGACRAKRRRLPWISQCSLAGSSGGARRGPEALGLSSGWDDPVPHAAKRPCCWKLPRDTVRIAVLWTTPGLFSFSSKCHSPFSMS